MRPIPFQTLSPFGSPRLRRPRPSSPAPAGAAFGSAAGQGFSHGAPTPSRTGR